MHRFDGAPFEGAKIALFCGLQMIAYQRDDFAHIPHPGLWDLPGGGREGDESPVECALREVEEELELRLEPAQVVWVRAYPGSSGLLHYFLAGEVTQAQVAAIRFGSEGQAWTMMPPQDFVAREDAVPHLRLRLADYMAIAGR